jgi:O-antigen/teichoic acid export membrane protein
MILARLLAPDDFGLMAVIIAVLWAFEAFAEVGVRQSIIQNKRGSNPEYLNVAWWFQAIRGLGLFAAGYFSAPWLCAFYTKPELLLPMRVAFTAILFSGLISPRVHLLEKTIRFGKWVFLYQGSGVFGTAVSLCLALFFVRNVWALVIGWVSESICRSLLSFALCPFLPRLRADADSFRDVLRYARGMFGVPILAMIALQLDILVLGKVTSAERLGMYSLALILALQPSTLFYKVAYPVLLPIFAGKQEDAQALHAAVSKVTRGTAVLAIPLTTFLIFCASSVLSVIYGPKYAAVATPFALLCVYALLRTQASTLSQLYFAIGRPQFHRRFVTLRMLILACLIYPAVLRFGLTGAAAAVLTANFAALCMQVIWTRKITGIRFGEYFSCWLPGLKLAVIVLVPVVLLKLLQSEIVLLNTAVGGLACVAACTVGLFLLARGGEADSAPSQRIA